MVDTDYLHRVIGRGETPDDGRSDPDDGEAHDETDDRPIERAMGDDGTGATPAPGDAETVGDQPAPETRLERSTDAVGYTAETERRLEPDDGLDVDVTQIEDVYPTSVPVDAAAQQARLLSTSPSAALEPARATRVASVARRHARADVPPSAYAATYERVLDRLVERAFDRLEAGDDPETAKEQLQAGIKATLVDLQVGVDEFADPDVAAPLANDEYLDGIGVDDVMNALPHAAFLIDDENTLLHYNVPQRRLINLGDDHREFVGTDCRDTIATATYSDGRRHYTLADRVAAKPYTAHEEWDIDRIDDENELTDHVLYEDTGITKDQTGVETHIRFLAMPLFDEDDDLVAVLELVHDRSTEVRRQQSVEALITEVTETLDRVGAGDLSARAEFEDEHDLVDGHLLELTDDVNGMAERFQEVVTRVDDRTSDLTESSERATAYADRIDEQATNQRDSLRTVADEMEDFSATMEEVAATSADVSDAANAALKEVDDGVAAGEDAGDVTDEVMAISEELVETVEELDEYMNEIGEVADVIADIADQTNLLALNANIEAAKAGDAGSGFAVVANEVKNLAAETQAHTDEIASRIEQVQDQTVETVEEVESSHEHIRNVEREINTVLASLGTISGRVEDAADGIQEVATANDNQAATVEEVVATVEDVRESSARVTETIDDIVDETDDQEAAIDELVERVRDLSGGDANS